MKVKCEDGRLSFDAVEFVSCMTLDTKREFADALACNSDVIEFVAQQILTGWTEYDSHGPKSFVAGVYPRGLEKAIRDIAKASGEVARKEIESLEEALKRVTDERDKLADKLRQYSFGSK